MATTHEPEEQTRFRAARTAALAEPHGWLSLTSFRWLGEEPASAEPVPGLWSASGDTAVLTATPTDALTDLPHGTPMDGTSSVTLADEDSLLWVAYGGGSGRRVAVELARRGGRYALRTRDAQAPALIGFTGVPGFDHDAGLVVRGEFEPYAEPVLERIGTAHPEVSGTAQLAGEVVFGLPGSGRRFRLRASQEKSGALAMTFHDRTNGVSTAPWRKVVTEVPRPDGTVLIDFNRAVNYPSAFTPFGTCPRPVEGNIVDAAIEAGERAPARPRVRRG